MRKEVAEFYEVQRFRQWWIWLTLILLNGVFVWGAVRQLVSDKPWGDNPMSDTGLLVFTLSMLLVSAAILSAKLKTYINKDGVYVQLFPYHLRYKFYDWSSIFKAHVIKYSPLRAGGWGIKISMDATKHYTVSGNMGLRLTLMNGRKVVIGTNKPDEMVNVLERLNKMRN